MFNSASRLAQTRPANTTAAEAFADADNRFEITRIHIACVGTTGATFRLFHDDAGGSTFDQTTALYYDVAIAAGGYFEWEAPAPGCGIVVARGGQIGVRTSLANELTFTLYGVAQSRTQQEMS